MVGDETTVKEDISFVKLLCDTSLMSVFAISFIGAFGANAAPAALPAIGNAFGVGTGRIGLIITLFYLPLIVLNPVFGILSDMFGRRRVILPSLLLFAVSGVATLAVNQFYVLLALRVIQAVSFAGTLPLAATLIGDLYSGAKGSTAQGLRSSVNGIANTVAPVLAGLLAVLNWRYPFLLFTIALPVMGLFYLYYPESTTPTVKRDALAELRTILHSHWVAIRAEATDRTLGVTLVGGFAFAFLKQGMKAYVPVYIVQILGGTTSTAGFVLGIYGATRILVAPASGPLSKRTGRKYGLIGALLLLGVSMAVIPFTHNFISLSVVIIVFAIAEATFNPILKSSIADLASADNRGGIMGSSTMLVATASTISPAIIGFLVVLSGFETAFVLAAIISFAYAGFVFVLVERARIDTTSTIS